MAIIKHFQGYDEKPEGWYEVRDAYVQEDGLSEDEANRAADEEFGISEDD